MHCETHYQCIAKSIIITRATNIWIKFTPFINGMWEKWVFFKYSVLQGKYMESVGMSATVFQLQK